MIIRPLPSVAQNSKPKPLVQSTEIGQHRVNMHLAAGVVGLRATLRVNHLQRYPWLIQKRTATKLRRIRDSRQPLRLCPNKRM